MAKLGIKAGGHKKDDLLVESPKEEAVKPKASKIEVPRYLLTTKASAQKMENCPNKSQLARIFKDVNDPKGPPQIVNIGKEKLRDIRQINNTITKLNQI